MKTISRGRIDIRIRNTDLLSFVGLSHMISSVFHLPYVQTCFSFKNKTIGCPLIFERNVILKTINARIDLFA